MNFAPAIVLDGKTITPKGYVWILGLALGGCAWALKEASEPKFIEMVRADLKKDIISKLEKLIQCHKSKIEGLKEEINRFNQR